MASLGDGFEIFHQAGKGSKDTVLEAYQANNVQGASVVEFISDVAESYAWADLIICRSGALTVSEVAAAGIGAIFVPFMHKDRQQALNAEQLIECSAAKMIEQPELSAERLIKEIQQLDRESLLDMANKAREIAKVNADSVVAEAIAATAN